MTYPSANGTVPTDDGAHDPSVISNGGIVHDDTSLETNAGTDLGTWSDNDVGTDKGSSKSRQRCR